MSFFEQYFELETKSGDNNICCRQFMAESRCLTNNSYLRLFKVLKCNDRCLLVRFQAFLTASCRISDGQYGNK